MPSALVTRFLCAAFFACSGVMIPVDLLLQQRMVARHLLELALARHVEARVAEMRRQHAVVVEQAYHQRRAHAGVLRLALRGLEDRGVRFQHLLAHQARGDLLVVLLIDFVRTRVGEDLAHLGDDHGGRHAARHFARVVAAHAVGEHH